MRIVRFMEMVSEVSDIWLPAHWGILVDSLVYPLAQAPYLDLLDDGFDQQHGDDRGVPG